MVSRNEAQIFTLEGLGAAVLIMLALYFVLQSPTVSTPPVTQNLNFQLAQLGRDALVLMDRDIPANSSIANSSLAVNLKEYLKQVNKSNPRIPAQMRKELSAMLPSNTMFNVVLCYANLSGINVTDANNVPSNLSLLVLNSDNTTESMTNLLPPRDSVTASRIVVIYDSELNNTSPFKVNATETGTLPERVPHVIEVRLELWYV